jgi:hypothetical protein
MSAVDLAIFTPKVWVAKGATVDVPLTTRLLSNGSPESGSTINFQLLLGSGTLTVSSVRSDTAGYARSTLHLSGLSSDVQGTGCLAPSNNPCPPFYVVTVAQSVLRLEDVSGSQQAIWVGQSFQPLSLRVTDSSTPTNPVVGATVSIRGAMIVSTGTSAALQFDFQQLPATMTETPGASTGRARPPSAVGVQPRVERC